MLRFYQTQHTHTSQQTRAAGQVRPLIRKPTLLIQFISPLKPVASGADFNLIYCCKLEKNCTKWTPDILLPFSFNHSFTYFVLWKELPSEITVSQARIELYVLIINTNIPKTAAETKAFNVELIFDLKYYYKKHCEIKKSTGSILPVCVCFSFIWSRNLLQFSFVYRNISTLSCHFLSLGFDLWYDFSQCYIFFFLFNFSVVWLCYFNKTSHLLRPESQNVIIFTWTNISTLGFCCYWLSTRKVRDWLWEQWMHEVMLEINMDLELNKGKDKPATCWFLSVFKVSGVQCVRHNLWYFFTSCIKTHVNISKEKVLLTYCFPVLF